MKKFLLALLVAVVLAWVVLFVTRTGVLIYQTKVQPGRDFVMDDYGNLGDYGHTSLVCRYVAATGIADRVYLYSPEDFGRESCTFVARDL